MKLRASARKLPGYFCVIDGSKKNHLLFLFKEGDSISEKDYLYETLNEAMNHAYVEWGIPDDSWTFVE